MVDDRHSRYGAKLNSHKQKRDSVEMSIVHPHCAVSLVQSVLLIPTKDGSEAEMEEVTAFEIADGYLVTSLTWYARGCFFV